MARRKFRGARVFSATRCGNFKNIFADGGTGAGFFAFFCGKSEKRRCVRAREGTLIFRDFSAFSAIFRFARRGRKIPAKTISCVFFRKSSIFFQNVVIAY